MSTILVVEDEKQYRNLLNLKLRSAGYQVLLAEDGEKALNLVKNAKIDLILLDLVMPNMSGHNFFYKMVNELKMNIPTIIITNSETPSIQEGIKEVIIKANVSVDEVIEVVEKYLS
jgi:CheY-like chemotaxis protein